MSILKKILNQKITIVVALIMLTIVASVPAFRNAIYEGDDLRFHLGRIQAIAEAISNHHIPVRYEDSAWFGHGYVSSLFYGNILLYFPALIFLAGAPIYRAMNLYIIMINLMTVLIGYYCFKRLFKDKYWGLFATICYTLAGYRLTNIYTRVAVGEYTAMAFLPLCIYGMYRLYTYDSEDYGKGIKQKIYTVLPFVLGVTGLIQSHILSTEMMALFILIFVLLNIKDFNRVFNLLLLSLCIIVLLNAFFIIPFIDSYLFMDLRINTNPVSIDLQGYGLYIKQLFGLITHGRGENYVWSTNEEGCFNVGLLVVFCEVLTLIYLVTLFVNWKKGNKIVSPDAKWFFQLVILGVLSMWMSTVYFPWEVVSKAGYIGGIIGAVQYPWRYVIIQNIVFVVTGTYAAKRLFRSDHLKYATTIIIFVLAVFMTGIFDYQLSFGKNITAEQAAEDWADKLYLPVGTDVDSLENTEVSFADTKAVLPVLAYDNVHVFDANNDEISVEKWEGNLLAIDKASYNEGIQVRYIEPWYWRVSEIISIMVLAGLIAYLMTKKLD